MKHTSSLRTILLRAAAVLFTSVAVLALFAFSPAVVHAQDETPPSELTPDPARLQELYDREQQALARQDEAGARIADGVARAQNLINKGSAAGLDTSALSAALAQFESDMTGAQAAHDAAAATLAAHAGFDAAGSVTDAEQARETLRSAGEALKSAASAYKSARETLHSAVQSWIEANKDLFSAKLEERYLNTLTLLGTQQTHIDKLGSAAARLQSAITRGQASGWDTSSLESVLAEMNSQLPQAQEYHDAAADILSAHEGFNGSGKVMDAAAARQTLRSAAEALDGARQINASLAQELRAAVEAWRAAHPAPEPTVAP